MILRGNVPFIDKARRAQTAGAVGVIFVNHLDELYVPLPYAGPELPRPLAPWPLAAIPAALA